MRKPFWSEGCSSCEQLLALHYRLRRPTLGFSVGTGNPDKGAKVGKANRSDEEQIVLAVEALKREVRAREKSRICLTDMTTSTTTGTEAIGAQLFALDMANRDRIQC